MKDGTHLTHDQRPSKISGSDCPGRNPERNHPEGTETGATFKGSISGPSSSDQQYPRQGSAFSSKAEGLVVSVPHKGYRVFTLNQEELVAFCELRFTLEAQALRYGIERNPKELVQKLHGILLKMQKNQDESMREEYLNLDTLFHMSFFKACQNDFLLEHYQKINSMIETMRHYISISNEATQKSLDSHQAIVNEIDQGRIPKAIELLEDHIVSWSKRSNIEFS